MQIFGNRYSDCIFSAVSKKKLIRLIRFKINFVCDTVEPKINLLFR